MTDLLQVKFAPDLELIQKKLGHLADNIQQKGISRGLTNIASPLKKQMKARAPMQRGGGALRRSIGQRQVTSREKNEEGLLRETRAIWVGPVRKVPDPKYKRSPGKKIPQYFKAKWVEFGTRPHRIPTKFFRVVGRGKKAKVKRMKVFGKLVTSVNHPGARAQPFIEPTYRRFEPQMPELFAKGIDRFLKRF